MNDVEAHLMTVFSAALDCGSAADRAAYLDRACAGDPALRERVEALLRAHSRGGDFLGPAAGPAKTTGFELGAAGPAPDAAPGSGAVIAGRYKLLERIGEGGMGEVWMAEQTEPVRRKVALKLIKPGMDSRQVLARFEAERQALALMDHPNIARVLDGGSTAAGRPFFVMELVKGVPITKYCDDHRLPPRERLGLFVSVCQAVQHAHQKGVIHRDLKPSNVLVAPYDSVAVPKVIDFGIAKAAGQPLTERTLFTAVGAVIGTPEYMSPEQAELNNQDIDTRSDVYSLGVLLYELLTGTTPLTRKRLKEAALLEVLRLVREEEPQRPSTRLSTTDELPAVAANRGLEPRKLSGLVRGELDWIVMKALEKDRNRRYESATGLGEDVRRYLADEPVQACPPSAWYRARKFARRNRGRLVIAAGVFLAVTVMAASIGWAVGDRAARRATVASQVRESLNAARTLLADNKVAAARQKLAEARAQLGNDRTALAELAAEVEASEAELDGWQQFLDLIDRAHAAEMAPAPQAALAADDSRGGAGTLSPLWEGLRPSAAVPFLLQALARYDILERDDWTATLEGSRLGREQVEHLRRTAYEELLWLANDVANRRQEHWSGGRLSREAAARQALRYLEKAASAHRPTLALYALRARCRQALGEEAAAQADRQRADQTAPTLALDHYLQGLAAYDSGQLAEGVQAFEAALRLEPTHYWSLMRLGFCLSDLGKGPEDFTGAARVFTGCILKRPDHTVAYFGRGYAYSRLGQYDKAVADYSQAIALDPKYAPPWHNRGADYIRLGQYDKAVADYSQAIALEPKVGFAWYNRGNAYARLGQYDKAVADYSQAIDLDPKHQDIWYAWANRGNAYSALRQYDKAVADFSQAIELNPKFALLWLLRGNAYANLGQHDKAIADFSQGIELKPKDRAGWVNRGIAYSALRQYDKAIADISKAIELDPKFEIAWRYRGSVYFDLCQYDKAVADCDRAIELDPMDALAWHCRGSAYGKLGQYDKALADLSKGIALDPKNANTWYNRGNAYTKLGQYDKAVADYSQAIDLDPKLALAWLNRGNAYANLGQYDKAVVDISKAIELDPKSEIAWLSRGNAYARLGQYDKAVADYSQAIDLDPKSEIAWYCRGSAHANLGQYDKAVVDISKAIELNPKDRNAWVKRGVVYCDHLGQPGKAVADFSQAIELDPKDAKIWYNRGVAYRNLRQYDKAIADFSEAIRLDPKLVSAWDNRGILYCDHLGKPDKAVADFSKVLELAPNEARNWCNRGNAYRNLGQYDMAVADYSKAIELDRKYVSAWFSRGVTYYKQGRYKKAAADYVRVIELDPGHAGAHTSLAWLLATCPDAKLRDPGRAVELAAKAVKLAPEDGNNWNNLGVAHYRAGDWKAAVAALNKSRKLSGGNAYDWLFLAMAHRKLGNGEEARKAYDRAVRWLEENKAQLDKDKERADELRQFRLEAEEVLELKKK
jgi:tetratricopeptide (TPR) repeat protein